MPFQYSGDVRYFTFNSLNTAGVVHAVFTRQGGVSPAPWASLNVGGTVGDDPHRVKVNRQRAFASLRLDPASLFDVWQVHSAQVIVADTPRSPQTRHPQADVILTNRPQVTLFMRFADCVPILLFDPVKRAIGMVHAGWLGTVKGAVRAAVETMQARFNSHPEDLLAAIGPSIGPDHYEVGRDVMCEIKRSFGQYAPELLQSRGNGTYLDLWGANHWLLEQVGVRHVEMVDLCTACCLDDWYSHRGEQGRTGRFGALLALSE